MDAKKLEHFRSLLISQLPQHNEHIREDQAAALELSDDGVKDSSDLAMMDVNKELALRLGERESQMVADIDQALLRIKEGSYGICARCGKQIDERRLEALPTARYGADLPGDNRSRQRRRRNVHAVDKFQVSASSRSPNLLEITCGGKAMRIASLTSQQRKAFSAVVCALMLTLTHSASVYACACCAEPGTWFQDTAKSNPQILAIVGQLSRRLDKTALLYLTAAGVEEVKGISRASETYTLRRIPPYTRDWKLEFTDEQSNRGTLSFTIPATAVFFGTDPRDNQQGGAGGPLLYKEWRFEGPVSGTGVFKDGTTAQNQIPVDSARSRQHVPARRILRVGSCR